MTRPQSPTRYPRFARVRRLNRRSPARPAEPALPYEPRHALLSRGELAFYRVLHRVIAPNCGIAIKPRLADIVKCPDHLWETVHGRRLSQKHVDFVLYDLQTTRIVAVVELDDRSHDSIDRVRRDHFLDAVLRSTFVPLVRVRAAARYQHEAIRQSLSAAIPSR
jgi:hypothetical protein